MTSTGKNNDIKLDIQPMGVKMNAYLERKIQRLIGEAKKILPEIQWADIYLKSGTETSQPRQVVVRLGIPGTDVVASDSGKQWKLLIKNVERRIVRQLEKRKALMSKTAFS